MLKHFVFTSSISLWNNSVSSTFFCCHMLWPSAQDKHYLVLSFHPRTMSTINYHTYTHIKPYHVLSRLEHVRKFFWLDETFFHDLPLPCSPVLLLEGFDHNESTSWPSTSWPSRARSTRRRPGCCAPSCRGRRGTRLPGSALSSAPSLGKDKVNF